MSTVLVAENYPANDNAWMDFSGFKDSGLFTVTSAVTLSEARVALAFHSGYLVDNAGHVYVELLNSSGTVLATSAKLLPQLVNWDFSETVFYFSGVNQIQLAMGTQYRLRVRTDSLWDYGGTGWLEIAIRSGNVAFRLYGSITGFTVVYTMWMGGSATGAPPVDPNVYQNGATVTVLGQGTMQRPGSIFRGWSQDHSPYTEYAPGQTFVITRNFVFNDEWSAARTLTYNGNGNTGGSAPTDNNSPYASGSTVTVLGHGNLVKTDHIFKGWATSTSGPVAYTQGQTFTISANTILYAVWAPTFTVAYNGNTHTGGTVPSNNNRYEQGQTFTAAQPGSMVKDGYSFLRWNTLANGSGTSYNAGATVTMGNANLTLYAQWQLVTNQKYTITYDGNNNTGGAVPNDTTQYDPGSTVTVRANTGNLVRTLYRFMGWAPTNNAVNPTYAVSGSTVTPSTFVINANTVLYAVWTRTYTLTYNGNTHTSGSAPTDSNNPYLSGTNATVLGQGTLQKTGHTFQGWDTSASATVASYQQGNTITMNADRTLYAIWQNNTPTTDNIIDELLITPNSQTLISRTHPASPNSMSLAGMGFTGKGKRVTEVQFMLQRAGTGNANATVIAKIYEKPAGANYYPISNILATSTNTYRLQDLPANSEVKSFQFNGSFTPQNGVEYVVAIMGNAGFPTSSTIPVDGCNVATNNSGTTSRLGIRYNGSAPGNWQQDKTFQIWFKVLTDPAYSVTYNGNGNSGGSVPVDGNSPYAAGSTVTVLGQGNLVRDNYTFQGWSLTLGGAVAYTQGQTFTVNANTVLYAVWQENPKYTVTYDGNTHTGGTAPVSQTGYVNNSIIVANRGSLVKTNYTFQRWNTLANGTGTSYNEGASLTLTTNVTLYAVWSENPKYTVTYHGNGNTGGTAPVDSNSPYYSGSTVTVLGPGSLVKTDHVFQGWDTDSTATTVLYTQGNTFNISTNMTLYAVWLFKPKFTVTYDDNDATSGNVPIDVNSYYTGDPVTVAANTGNLAKTNHAFKGWSFNKSAASPDFTVTGSNVSPSTFNMGSGNETLYAVWQENPKYTLSFDGNENTGGTAPQSQTEYVNTVVTVPNQGVLLKTNYTFSKWNTQANGSGTDYTVGSNFTFTANTILYAIWNENPKYTLSYDGNGHTSGSPPQSQTDYVGNAVTVAGPGDLAKTDHTFTKWNTASDGSGTDYSQGHNFILNGNVKLYAQWTNVPTYTVSYLPGLYGAFASQVTGGLFNGDPTPAPPQTIGEPGYSFSHWSPTPSSTVAGNATYTAMWTQDKYTVVYAPGSQGTFTQQTTTNLVYGDPTPVAPTVTGNLGYTFTGWNPTPSSTVTGNATYTATWTQSRYTVTFAPGTQGTFIPQVTENLTYGDPTPSAPVPTGNPGYTFNNWSPTPAATVTDNATYTATWTQDRYTVKYNPGTQGTFPEQTTSNLLYGDPTPSAPTVTGQPGWSFNGWQPTPTSTVTNNATYVAQWTQLKYTVRFEPGTHGTFTAQEHTNLVYGELTPTPPTTTGIGGWAFNGWQPVLSVTVMGNVTYVAQWRQETYTVTFSPGLHGAFLEQVTSGLLYGVGTPVPPVPTPKTGYLFVEWLPVITATVTKSVTYTAQWTVIIYNLTYNGNGATGNPPIDSTPYSIENPYATIKSEGSLFKSKHVFDGWNTNPNAPNGLYNQGDQFHITTNTTLYAIWIKQTVRAVAHDSQWIWEEIRRAKQEAGIIPHPGKNPYDP